MNREEFFARLAAFGDEGVRKALWNLYRQGSLAMQERIERQLGGETAGRSQRPTEEIDAESVLAEIRAFAVLARSGAYLAGDRRVSPRERTRWRFTFQRLSANAQSALHTSDVASAIAAMEELIDLACELRRYDYFRSDDPVEAARFVVSDAVTRLWSTVRDTSGFAVFAEWAAPQLVRWESPYGWTRYGSGRVSERESSLTDVVARMLPALDMWVGFADRYLDALDRLTGDPAGATSLRRPERDREERARALAEWHGALIDRLVDTDAEDRLDRLVDHPALGGPEQRFLQARLAAHRGDLNTARRLVDDCLRSLPGHTGFLAFAASIARLLPPPPQHADGDRQRPVGSAPSG